MFRVIKAIEKQSISFYVAVSVIAISITFLGALEPQLSRIVLFIILMAILAYQHPLLGIALNFNGSYIFTYIFNLSEVESGILLGMRLILLVSFIRISQDKYFISHPKQQSNITWIMGGLIVMLIGLLYSDSPQYGLGKTLRYFAFNIMLFVTPLFIRWNRETFISLLNSIAVIGVVGGWVSVVFIVYNGLDLSARISLVEHVNVIWISRSMGISILAIIGLFLLKEKDLFSVFLLLSLPGLIITMLLSGSRGPILALFIAIFITVVFMEKRKKSTIIALFMGFILTGAIALGITYLSSSSVRLLTDPTNLKTDISALHRAIAWLKSIELITDNPLLGIGTGSFLKVGNEILPWLPKNIWGYPHNIFLELTVEHGLIGLIIFMIPFIRIFIMESDINKRKIFIDQAIILGFFTFALINAQFGGDITRNEGLWYSAGLLAALNTDIKKNDYFSPNPLSLEHDGEEIP